MVAIRGAHPEAAFGATAEALLAHQAGDAVAAIHVTGARQRRLNPGAAVGLAAGRMGLDNALDQLGVFPGAPAGLGLPVLPIVIAAGGNFQGLAERANGMLGFHRVNPLKAFLGGSERMPKVFFKMSRCWRR